MKAKIEALKKRYLRAKTDAQREAIREEMIKLFDEDPDAVSTALLEGIRETVAKLSALENNS